MTRKKKRKNKGNFQPRIDARRRIRIECLSTGRSWAHTVGLNDFGLPELEILDVPRFLYPAVAQLLWDVADLMLNGDRPVLEGELITLNSRFSMIRLIASPDAGTHPLYEKLEVWRLVEEPNTCPCAVCAAERGVTECGPPRTELPQ